MKAAMFVVISMLAGTHVLCGSASKPKSCDLPSLPPSYTSLYFMYQVHAFCRACAWCPDLSHVPKQAEDL